MYRVPNVEGRVGFVGEAGMDNFIMGTFSHLPTVRAPFVLDIVLAPWKYRVSSHAPLHNVSAERDGDHDRELLPLRLIDNGDAYGGNGNKYEAPLLSVWRSSVAVSVPDVAGQECPGT